MPELPEVEVTRRGIAPHLTGRVISAVAVRDPRLRWPIPRDVLSLAGRTIKNIERRGKYLLVDCGEGHLILHLGMSGSLRVLPRGTPAEKHDHFDLVLGDRMLRLRDPRRFGCQLWQPEGTVHPLLAGLGPEPLSDAFDGDRLWALSRGRKAAVKLFLMDQAIVVGVGNIYASEALFAAGIDPRRAAGAVSRARYARLADEVKRILAHAITRGGTTLRDFISPDGLPGYFEQELFAYGRDSEPCKVCGAPIRAIVLGQRSTFFCARCQR